MMIMIWGLLLLDACSYIMLYKGAIPNSLSPNRMYEFKNEKIEKKCGWDEDLLGFQWDYRFFSLLLDFFFSFVVDFPFISFILSLMLALSLDVHNVDADDDDNDDNNTRNNNIRNNHDFQYCMICFWSLVMKCWWLDFIMGAILEELSFNLHDFIHEYYSYEGIKFVNFSSIFHQLQIPPPCLILEAISE